MVVTVMGRIKKPYNIDGNSVISSRLSVFCGSYGSDPNSGTVGEGDRFLELRCPLYIFDAVSISDDLSIEVDDKLTRIKSAMIQVDTPDGRKAFIPLEE